MISSIVFYYIFICILAGALLILNFALAPHKPYEEKDKPFECGYQSFLGQNRSQISIAFIMFAFLFLLFDLELLLVYPHAMSSYIVGIYGLIIAGIFIIVLVLGLVYELGRNALYIPSKQTTKKIIFKNRNIVVNSLQQFIE